MGLGIFDKHSIRPQRAASVFNDVVGMLETIQKLEGVSPGVPDLFIPAWNLWVEMKRSVGGRLSAEQKDWISYLQDVGHCAIVCAGCNDAQEKVRQFEKGSVSNSSPAASGRG